MRQDKNETLRENTDRMKEGKEEREDKNRRFLPIFFWTD
jgi:hypothetical protein